MAQMKRSPKSWKKSGTVEGGYDAGTGKAYYGKGHPQEPMTVTPRTNRKSTGSMQKPSREGYVVGADTMRVNPKSRKEIIHEGLKKSGKRVQEVRERGTSIVQGFGNMFPVPPMGEMRMPTGMGQVGLGFALPAGWMMGPFGASPPRKEPTGKKGKKKREPREQETSLSDMMAIPEHARRWMM